MQHLDQPTKDQISEVDSRIQALLLDVARLEDLYDTQLLDTDAENCFDRLTQLGVELLGAPAVFLSLIDKERDFYKSQAGFPEPLASKRELTGRTFCHFTLLNDTPLIIADTLADPIYAQVPTVETLGIRAYAGIPLLSAKGHHLGSFCAVDFQPRQWDKTQVRLMTELASSTIREIQLRQAIRRAWLAESSLTQHLEKLESTINLTHSRAGTNEWPFRASSQKGRGGKPSKDPLLGQYVSRNQNPPKRFNRVHAPA